MRKILPWLLLALLLTGCQTKPLTQRDFILNTEVYVTVYRHKDQKAAESALKLCREYEKVFSRTDPESELHHLNSRRISQVSDELAQVIALGLDYAQLSDGAFDITMGGITNLWDFTTDTPSLPDAAAVDKALSHSGWEGVAVEGNTVIFRDDATILDLGAIAKGYIADRMAEHLAQQGVSSAIISLGGNIYSLGQKPDGSDFQVGIQYPYEERNTTLGGLPASNKSVVTSGLYERCFTLNGKLYHHILDPKTGWPVENDLLAVSIVSQRSVDGDALSTACFVLGLEEGMDLIESLEDIEAIFVTADFQYHLSPGLVGVFYE